jgi:thiol:disulfide interchange protein DsbD
LLVLVLPALAHAAGADQLTTAMDRGWGWVLLSVFGAGIGTALTPCVYPMIPIIMGIFGARGTRGETVSRGRAFSLASMYVLGLCVMYSSLGVGVALAGGAFGAFLANPWVVWPLVAFYCVLAASMFGAFDLDLPQSWRQRLSKVGGKGYVGAFGMGLVGGLTAAPCTGPMLLGLLGFIGKTRNVPVGFGLMFTYALGMGTLFLVLALFAQALPKSGSWMDWVKSIFGIALLIMGVYFLRPVLPQLDQLVTTDRTYLAIAIGALIVGVALGAIHLSFHGPFKEKLRKGIGVGFAFVGGSLALLWLISSDLKGWQWRCADAKEDQQKATCFTDDAKLLAEAKAAGKPVLIDFGAQWCGPCKKYDATVFSDPAVHAALADGYVALKFDVTEENDADVAAQKRHDAMSLPTVIIIGPDGEIARTFHEPIPTPQEFAEALKRAKSP